MHFSFANVRNVLAGLLVAGVLGSCGSASNNDQGASFTLLGYFASVPSGDSTTLPTALSGLSILLTDSTSPETAPGAGNFGSGTVLAAVGVQNNLSAQFIRTDQVFFEYNVPGAQAQPPTTNYPLSVLLGAADSNLSPTPTSTLPGGFNGLANRAFAEVPVLPAEIREWLSLNRDLLPDRPFTMTVRTVVSGVSSAGDRFDTNASELLVQVNDDTIIAPTAGTPVSESSGGSGTP